MTLRGSLTRQDRVMGRAGAVLSGQRAVMVRLSNVGPLAGRDLLRRGLDRGRRNATKADGNDAETNGDRGKTADKSHGASFLSFETRADNGPATTQP
jgi:hypothetical protein